MSPEQAAGDLDRTGPPSDIYSLGATLYQVLTGRPPFAGDDLYEVLGAVRRGDLVPPRQVNPRIPRALEAVVLKAMATQPIHRYDSCQSLANDLERWMGGWPVAARGRPRGHSVKRRTQGRAGILASGAAALTALGRAVLGRTHQHERQTETRDQGADAGLDMSKHTPNR
jgi:hypothetical protein